MNYYFWKRVLLLFAVVTIFSVNGLISTVSADSKLYFEDIKIYETLAKQVLSELNSGELTSIDKLLAINIKLINLGSNACRVYALKNPEDSKLMNLVLNDSQKMQKLSIQEMQEQWHDNTFLVKKGINLAKLESTSVSRSLMDTIVHPATANVALNEYKQTGDKKYLGQARQELMKSLDHLKVIQ